MKNLYIKGKQIDKDKLYTRFSRYVILHGINLISEIEPYINKMEVSINFDQDYYTKLDKDQKSFYGDSVDSLLSGGSYAKVNGYRKYFHQVQLEPSEELKTHIENTKDELVRFLQTYLYEYPRWKTVYYPDGVYRTHLDLIANNCWKGQEAFDVCISTNKEVMLFKLIELLALTNADTFDFVNVLNLYNGNWFSIRGKSVPDNVINKCKNLFLSFVELRKEEERSNTNE